MDFNEFNAPPLESLELRYARAAALTPPKVAVQDAGIAITGYWLNDYQYFCLRKIFHKDLDYPLSTPAVADMRTRSVHDLISSVEISKIIEASGFSCALESMRTAQFDMPAPGVLAVTIDGINHTLDIEKRCIRSSEPLPASELYSPDGQFAAFISGADLWLRDRRSGEQRALTRDGVSLCAYGQQPDSSLGAISYRKRPAPMAVWSPDSKWLLTHRIDERALPEAALIETCPVGKRTPVLHRVAYPRPGDPTPIATYIAINVPTGERIEFSEVEVPAFFTSPFSNSQVAFISNHIAWFLRFDRHSRRAELIELSLPDRRSRIVVSEQVNDGYIELHHRSDATPNVRYIQERHEVLWYSERDGWGHLYVYDSETGRVKRQLTSGNWMVRDILHVDVKSARVYFSACGVDPMRDPAQRVLCAINLDSSGLTTICAHDGDFVVPRTEMPGFGQNRPSRPIVATPGFSPTTQYVTSLRSDVATGNVTQIVDLENGSDFVVAEARPSGSVVDPLKFFVLAGDGITRIHGTLFFPSDFDKSANYPLIDYIYPGPQLTQNPQMYGSINAAQAKCLAELGFVVLMLDTRGVPFRQRSVRQAGYGGLLEPQLSDHAAAVWQLCENHTFIDRERIGIVGFSGGGYAAASAMLEYPGIFKVGVSICGNHNNRAYHTSWSDKYLGPVDPDRVPGISRDVNKLSGKLLLISGDMDENVLPSHSLALASALIQENKDFDLLLVPNEGHLLWMTNGYVQRRVWDYFVKHLLNLVPPTEFRVQHSLYEQACARALFGRDWQ